MEKLSSMKAVPGAKKVGDPIPHLDHEVLKDNAVIYLLKHLEPGPFIA